MSRNIFEFTNARLTKDPEVKYTPTQTAICNLVLAVDTGYGEKKKTDFPRVTVFGKQAEAIERYSAKGLRVDVTGHIQTGSYQKDGTTVYTTDLIADYVDIVDFKERPHVDEAEADCPF